MTNGELALVLHAHLPYVRSAEPGSLEEDWFFQALMECYLPLLKVLEDSAKIPEQNPKLTISLSPTLLSLLKDPVLKNRFPSWLNSRINLLVKAPFEQRQAAEHLEETIQNQLHQWNGCEGDLIKRFANLQRLTVVDILTCAATHGYLPLLRQNPEAVRGQLRTAVKEHLRIFKTPPLGIWLPECAYYEGLDNLMIDAGLRYAVLDGHGLLHASPRPRYGLYAPICSSKGVAFFGRDSESTLPVWSSKEGYPGDPLYREFHRDLGWDLPLKELQDLNLKEPRPLGLKLHRVTSQSTPLNKKEVYEPKLAASLTKEHAKHYLKGRRDLLNRLSEQIDINPLLVAPFDAELFGHWWFEGPLFLAELFKQAQEEKIYFTRLRDVLNAKPNLQLCEPSPSSWGQGGFHDYWLNESNAWVVAKWSKSSKIMVDLCRSDITGEFQTRLLKQAARELLLSQSSDWSFILRAGTTTDLAKDRILRHLDRFWKLTEAIKSEKDLSQEWIRKLEIEDGLFPLIQTTDWC